MKTISHIVFHSLFPNTCSIHMFECSQRRLPIDTRKTSKSHWNYSLWYPSPRLMFIERPSSCSHESREYNHQHDSDSDRRVCVHACMKKKPRANVPRYLIFKHIVSSIRIKSTCKRSRAGYFNIGRLSFVESYRSQSLWTCFAISLFAEARRLCVQASSQRYHSDRAFRCVRVISTGFMGEEI